MRIRRILALLFVLLLASIVGCAVGMVESGPRHDQGGVRVVVENQSWCDVTVKRLVRGLHEVRVGRVTSLSSESFKVPVEDGVLFLVAVPFACADTRPVVFMPVPVQDGTGVRVVIRPQQQTSDVVEVWA